MTSKNASYWKIEANYHGSAGNIDHDKPEYKTAIYLMERNGEL